MFHSDGKKDKVLYLSNKFKVNYIWVITAVGFISQSFGSGSAQILPITLLMVEKALKISHTDAGLIVSASSVSQIIGFILWGLISDKIGLRKTLTVSSLIISIGTICMGIINSRLTGMAAYALCGFGVSAFMCLLPKLLKTWFEKRKRGLAASVIGSGSAVTSSLMGILVPFLVQVNGWRFPFLLVGAISLISPIIVYSFLRDNPKEKGLAPIEASSNEIEAISQDNQSKLRHILKMKLTWQLIIMYFFFNIGFICVITYLVSYVIETGQDMVGAGRLFTVYMACGIFSGYILGILSDHAPRTIIIAISCFLQAVFMGVFIILSKGIVTNYVMLILIGLTSGIMPVTSAMFSDYYDARLLGIVTGLIMCVGGIGSILVVPIAGFLATKSGTLAIPLAISAVSLAIAAIISLTLIKRAPIPKLIGQNFIH